MKHYLKRLEESIKANWKAPALGNYGGETFTFEQVATQIEKLHLFFENINIAKGEKVVEPNPFYPDEGYEEFVSRMIVEKKKKIRQKTTLE